MTETRTPTSHDEAVPETTAPSLAVAATELAPTSPAAGMGGLWALFAGLGLMMVGNGLNGAVIGIRSGTEGFSVTVTGVIMAGYFAGFLLAPTLVVRMIAAVGHIRVFAGLASTASSAVLVHALFVVPVSWTAMRFVFGFCMAGLYIVIESWLSEMSGTARRGRTLALYMIVSMSGLGIGQYLVAVADPNGFRLFVVSSVLVSMSLVPVTLAATTKAPQIDVPDKVGVRELLGLAPTGVLGAFLGGAATGVLFALGAVYATTVGFSLERTGAFLLAPTLGAILLQWPIGRLSDKVPRRSVIFGVAVVAAGVCACLVVVDPDSAVVPALMLLVGGTLFPLYSLVVSYTLDWTPPGRIVGASGTLIRVNGSGALVGPLIVAPLMSEFGPTAFYWSLFAAFATLVVMLVWRIAVKEAMPMERQRAFVPFPARAGSTALAFVVKPVRKATRIATGKHVTSRRHPHQHADAEIAADVDPDHDDPGDPDPGAVDAPPAAGDDGSPGSD